MRKRVNLKKLTSKIEKINYDRRFLRERDLESGQEIVKNVIFKLYRAFCIYI